MNYIIRKSIFEGKPSLYTGRLALSTPLADYTYGKIAGTIASIAGYINYYSKNRHIKKIVLLYNQREEALLVTLALVKMQVEVVLAGDDLPGVSVQEIIATEAPDLVIAVNNEYAGKITCPVIKMDSNDVGGYEIYDVPVKLADVKKNLKINIYAGSNQPAKTTFDNQQLENVFDEISRSVNMVMRDIYLVAGHIPFNEFLIESLWCLFSGIHLLSYNYSDNIISEIQPGEKQFTMDFTLFFFGSVMDNADDEDCYELLMNCVKHADTNNYAGIWTPERHFNEFGGKYPNPSVLSAAIAAVTRTIQIRTGSIVAPLHHVVRIAEDWSVIDNLSGGRTALSFASGWQCNDFVFFPERYAARHEVMMEQINVFRKLWSGDQLEFNNGAGNKIKVGIYPRPVQHEIPVWVTVSGRIETFIDAGRIGANILTHLLWQDPSELIDKIKVYRQSLKENGFEPSSRIVSVMLHTYIGRNSDEVRRIVEKPLKEYIRSSVNLVETMTKTAKSTRGNNAIGRYARHDEQVPENLKDELLDFAFERFLSHSSLVGDEEHCSKILQTLHSYGVDELACLIDFGLENDIILEGLDRLKKLKDRYSASSQKKYSGNIILRSSKEALLQLIEARPEDLDNCRKIVTGNDSCGGYMYAFNGHEEFLNWLSNQDEAVIAAT